MKGFLKNRNVITVFMVICGIALIYCFVKSNYIGAMVAIVLLFVSGPLYSRTNKPVKKNKKKDTDEIEK